MQRSTSLRLSRAPHGGATASGVESAGMSLRVFRQAVVDLAAGFQVQPFLPARQPQNRLVHLGELHVGNLILRAVLVLRVVQNLVTFRSFDDDLPQILARYRGELDMDSVLARHRADEGFQQRAVGEQALWEPVHVGIDDRRCGGTGGWAEARSMDTVAAAAVAARAAADATTSRRDSSDMAAILMIIIAASVILCAEPTLSRAVQLRFNFEH